MHSWMNEWMTRVGVLLENLHISCNRPALSRLHIFRFCKKKDIPEEVCNSKSILMPATASVHGMWNQVILITHMGTSEAAELSIQTILFS